MKSDFTGILRKSDNAIAAEERGLVTYSRLKAWQKRAVDAGALPPCEWHHTGAAANRTYYYDPADFDALDPADFPLREEPMAQQADLTRIKLRIVYDKAVGGFSRGARMKFEEVVAFGHPDVRKGDGKITGVGGRRLGSNNKSVEVFYLPPKCRKWRAVSIQEAKELGYEFA